MRPGEGRGTIPGMVLDRFGVTAVGAYTVASRVNGFFPRGGKGGERGGLNRTASKGPE